MKYGKATLGQIEAVWNRFGGQEGVEKFLRGELVVQTRRVVARVFKTWKTIKLCTGLNTADDFRSALNVAGYKINIWADGCLDRLNFSVRDKYNHEWEVELVKVSVEELGFVEEATLIQVYARAHELGLRHCPGEVAPQLRLQYEDQPKNEHLFIATVPMGDNPYDGVQGLFTVINRDCQQWLSGGCGEANYVPKGSVFVFRK